MRRILLISGSTRGASSNSALLRTAAAVAETASLTAVMYAGTLPGSMKNLLDWTVGGTEMTGKSVAWVNAAADGRRGHGATTTLATVLGYVQAEIVESACRHIPVQPGSAGADGLITDEGTRSQLRDVLNSLLVSRAN